MDFFKSLEHLPTFEAYVQNHFQNAPNTVAADFVCVNTVDTARIQFAHGEYMQNVKAFTVLLLSENPDQYKRAGALLQALLASQIVTEIKFDDNKHGSIEDIESDPPLGLSYANAQDMTRLPRFYKEYYNELLSFDLAYQCCAAYEQDPRPYDVGFLENICFYLQTEDVSVDACAMMFRALMH